jgi:hypothetical protein
MDVLVWTRVRFSEPVEGPDPHVSHRTIDDRHELQCEWLRHHGEETLFGAGDEVIERWPTKLIEMVEWRPGSMIERDGLQPKGPSLIERRSAAGAPRLGERWTEQEDAELRDERGSGIGVADIARAHGRNPGAN